MRGTGWTRERSRVAIATITPDPIGVFVDDGIYLLIAKAIAAGEGYRYTFLPGAPAAIHYPPVFPLVLAAMLKISPTFPDNVAVLKFVNPIFFAIGAFGAASGPLAAVGLVGVA